MTDHVDTGTRRERHIPVVLSQPIVLDIHNPNGDVAARAADRSDVLITYSGPALPDGWGEEAFLSIEAHDNRISVHVNPQFGGVWGGFAGEVDIDAIVGQVTRAFRWGGPSFSGKAGKMRFGSGHHSWIDIAIELPRESSGRLEIHTASGDLQVEGVTSEMALKTASGDVRTARTHGDLDLHTASGDLNIEESTGRLSAHTANGDIQVISSHIDGFQIQTASGDIAIDGLLVGDRSSSAQTASGDVQLTLRRPTAGGEEPDVTLAFHTVSGDAHVGAPFRKIDRRLWQAGRGDGGPRIDITTVSGDLAVDVAASPSAFARTESSSVPASHIVPAPPAAPEVMAVPPTPPSEPAPPEVGRTRGKADAAETIPGVEAKPSLEPDDTSRLAVLEAVERGEIDVEEALRRLEAADPTVDQ